MEARETIKPEERALVRQLSLLYLEKIQAAKRVSEVRMILRLLNRRLSSLPERFPSHIQQLTIPQLEDLDEALLDFTNLIDLEGLVIRN